MSGGPQETEISPGTPEGSIDVKPIGSASGETLDHTRNVAETDAPPIYPGPKDGLAPQPTEDSSKDKTVDGQLDEPLDRAREKLCAMLPDQPVEITGGLLQIFKKTLGMPERKDTAVRAVVDLCLCIRGDPGKLEDLSDSLYACFPGAARTEPVPSGDTLQAPEKPVKDTSGGGSSGSTDELTGHPAEPQTNAASFIADILTPPMVIVKGWIEAVPSMRWFKRA